MNLKEQILYYKPENHEEKIAKEEMIKALELGNDSVFYRENKKVHFTTSGFVMNPDLDMVLMVYHNIYQSYSWTGGHADGEQDLMLKAIEEAKEETGIQEVYPYSTRVISLDILEVQPHEKNGQLVEGHKHFSVAYGLIAPMKQQLTVKEDENKDVKWIEIEDILEKCEEAHMVPIYLKLIKRMNEIRIEKKINYEKTPGIFLKWYEKNARDLPWRKDQDPYHVWLSEIMLQQTRVEAVRGYYKRFLKALPTIEALANVEIDKLLKLWEGLGYYNRAKNMQKAAIVIMEKYNGEFPREYDEILELPGIGEYTAGAVASICFHKPTPAVDGNVLRVISRITEDFQNISKPAMKKRIQKSLEEIYPKSASGSFTQSIMEIGAMVCIPNGEPKCLECPANPFCMAYHNQSTSLLPVKSKKKERKIEEKTVFVLCCGDKVAIRKREKKGLLAGLWELPNITKKTMEEAITYAADIGVKPVSIEKEIYKNHIFTHIEWRMTCYYLKCRVETEDFYWVTKEQLADEYALPTAFRQFI